MVATGRDNLALLGKGLYTAKEVARYARIPSANMARRWALGVSPVIQRELPDEANRWLTFLDFAQLQAIRAVQLFDPEIPLQRIRAAIEWFEKTYHIDRPLARKHKIIPHGRDLWIAVDGVNWDDEPQFELATGRRGKGQLMLDPIAELYQRDMQYIDGGGYATLFRLYHDGDRAVVMDPNKHLGSPMLPSGYSLDTLLEAVRIEGGIERAARVYGVPEDEIQLAIDCNDQLGLVAA